MVLFVQIMGVLFMATIMFVAIWGFINQNQMLAQMKYKNYLLEKLTQNVYMLASKNTNESSLLKAPCNDEKDIEV